MFAKPEWFRTTQFGLGIAPNHWKGWVAMLTGLLAVVWPAWLLASKNRGVESLIWLAIAGWMALREVRTVHHAKRRDELFVIDEETDVTQITTDKYDLELRR